MARGAAELYVRFSKANGIGTGESQMLRVTNPARTLVDPMRSLASGCVYEITGVLLIEKQSAPPIPQTQTQSDPEEVCVGII